MVTDDLVTGSNEWSHETIHSKTYLTEPLRKTTARGHKTVLGAPCSNSMLKPRSYSRRLPNVLSTLSFSDLRMKRPNPDYDQEHAQRRTQTKFAANVEIG